MSEDTKTIKIRDFHRFFREMGIAKEQPCPRCGEPRQFGWTDDPELMGDGEWTVPPAGSDPGSNNFYQYCDRCGFVEVYFLTKFFEWMRSK